jgi:hypothetical protein
MMLPTGRTNASFDICHLFLSHATLAPTCRNTTVISPIHSLKPCRTHRNATRFRRCPAGRLGLHWARNPTSVYNQIRCEPAVCRARCPPLAALSRFPSRPFHSRQQSPQFLAGSVARSRVPGDRLWPCSRVQRRRSVARAQTQMCAWLVPARPSRWRVLAL